MAQSRKSQTRQVARGTLTSQHDPVVVTPEQVAEVPAEIVEELVAEGEVVVVAEQATPAAALEVGPAVPATALPAKWNPQLPSAKQSAADFTQFKLPVSLAAKGEGLVGGNIPPEAQGFVFKAGKQFTARSAHNAEWAERALQCIRKAGGQATAEQIVAAGCGWHSIAAFAKRGWLVKAKVAVKA